MLTRVVSLALLGACGPALHDTPVPTGSTTVVSAFRGDVVVVNQDAGTIARVSGQRDVEALLVGEDPARIARVGSELWVTLRGEGAVAVVGLAENGTLEVVDTLAAGIEPFGIVADRQGRTVYVASSIGGEVLEIEAASRAITRRFAVPDEPRWLALHPSGDSLYVASALRGTLSRVDLTRGEVEPVALPQTIRYTFEGVSILTPRITGDPSIRDDGGALAVPLLMVDATTPVESIPEGEEPMGEEPTSEGYGSSGLGISRMNPTLVTVDLDGHGAPDGEVQAVFLGTSFLGGRAMFDGMEDMGKGIVRSYPSSVTWTRDALLVTAEGSAAVYGVYPKPFEVDFGMPDMTTPSGGPGGPVDPFTPPQEAGFEVWPIRPVATGHGPRGIALAADGTAWVHAFLDRQVARLDVAELEDQLQRLSAEFFIEEDEMGQISETTSAVTVADPSLSATAELGRRLFYAADDARMVGAGAGVSCATCHFDGRLDGLTWTIDGQPRQTPSLAGPVSQTAPVTWTDDVVSVADEALLTTSLRMGGEGLSQTDADAIAAYVETTPYPDARRTADEAMVREGEGVFLRSGCATCHSGALYTDNLPHEVFPGLAAQTPTLRGIGASAPYFHDGSAPDLRAVLAVARTGAMGDPLDVTAGEVDALVAFLESL